MKQAIVIEFELYDEDMSDYEAIPVEERAENIAHFVSDELIAAGTIVSYKVINATLLD